MFHGIYPMLFAFYNNDGGLDRGAMQAQVEFCLNSGAHGVACLGLGTEVSALSGPERVNVMNWASSDLSDAGALMVTVAGKTATEALSQLRAAEDAGAHWVVFQPPIGAKPDEEELFSFFADLISQTTLPAGIQNAPEYLGTGLSPNMVLKLAGNHQNFTVMKGEGPVCSIREYIELVGDKLAIFNGRGGLELPDNLRAGCAGVVPASDMVDKHVAIYNAVAQSDLRLAYALYRDLLPLIVFIMQSLDHFLCYGKVLAAQRIGIKNSYSSRISPLQPDAFGNESLQRFCAMASIEQNG